MVCGNHCPMWITASFFLAFLKVGCARSHLLKNVLTTLIFFVISVPSTFGVSVVEFLFYLRICKA